MICRVSQDWTESLGAFGGDRRGRSIKRVADRNK